MRTVTPWAWGFWDQTLPFDQNVHVTHAVAEVHKVLQAERIVPGSVPMYAGGVR